MKWLGAGPVSQRQINYVPLSGKKTPKERYPVRRRKEKGRIYFARIYNDINNYGTRDEGAKNLNLALP